MRKIILQNGERAERPCVATLGFFDGVHRGHQHLIHQVTEAALRLGLDATVVTFDVHPRQALQEGFQPRLLNTYDERLIRLATTGADNCAILHFDHAMASLSAREFMEKVLRDQLGVRQLILGYDNRFGHDRSEGFDDYVRYGRELGIEVVRSDVYLVDGQPVSSSAIRKVLAEGTNTIVTPEIIPGTLSGKTTLRSTLVLLAPKSSAASIRRKSILDITV